MWILFLLIFCIYFSNATDVCFNTQESCININKNTKRYLLYDINKPEGFNLRRDVYLRLAVLAHKMKISKNDQLKNFHLVLPPWSNLIHWEYKEYPEHIPWGYYFDIGSLKTFAPVLEMYEFFMDYPNRYTKVEIDQVFTLQHFKDMFETGNFEDRIKVEECHMKHDYTYYSYKNMTAKSIQCLSFHGPATKLTEVILKTTANIILINHAEVALHDFFGSRLYWQARRSMRFNKELKVIAAEFRKKYLKSTDDDDQTNLPESWTDETPNRNAIGGPYVAIHLRRRDFVENRAKEVPSLEQVSEQIITVLKKLDLNTVFVATDGTFKEFEHLSHLLNGYTVLKFNPSTSVKEKYKDGGVAIIDQIICSYSRYFIGTHESTFSFRIQEEREILGFKVKSTFNVFCTENACPKPSIWEIVY